MKTPQRTVVIQPVSVYFRTSFYRGKKRHFFFEAFYIPVEAIKKWIHGTKEDVETIKHKARNGK